MAFSVLRSVAKCVLDKGLAAKVHNTKHFMNACRCVAPLTSILTRQNSNFRATDQLQQLKTQKYYKSSESETDSDLEPPGHRGESLFWRRKLRTFHGILDVNKDGVISYDDFMLLSHRFIELGHLSEKHTQEFRNLLRDLWEKRWGPISPYNLVTVEQFLDDMHHVINDKRLVRRAHSFLPYLFKAVDKDKSGEISESEFKLFFQCLGLKEEDATLAFKCIDTDGDGAITKREFVKHGREFFLTEDENSVSKYFFGPLTEH